VAETHRLLRPGSAIVLSAIVGAALLPVTTAEAARLNRGTVVDWDRYVTATEVRIGGELGDGGRFLVQDRLPGDDGERCRQTVAAGDVCVAQLETADGDGDRLRARKGLIHHWLGSIFVPDIDLDSVISWVQEYDHHSRWFDEVDRSRLVHHSGDAYTIDLQLRRKKVVTVRYDTRHDVTYRHHGSDRVSSRSVATRIAELRGEELEAGTKPIGDDRGFLWRLNSYWRYREVDAGVIVECESISLSRGIPPGLGWIVKPFVKSVPRESLQSTLRSIRGGLAAVSPDV